MIVKFYKTVTLSLAGKEMEGKNEDGEGGGGVIEERVRRGRRGKNRGLMVRPSIACLCILTHYTIHLATSKAFSPTI